MGMKDGEGANGYFGYSGIQVNGSASYPLATRDVMQVDLGLLRNYASAIVDGAAQLAALQKRLDTLVGSVDADWDGGGSTGVVDQLQTRQVNLRKATEGAEHAAESIKQIVSALEDCQNG